MNIWRKYLFLGLSTLVVSAGQVSAAVTINEFKAKAATGDPEFIEFFNSGAAAVDLSGWSVTSTVPVGSFPLPAGSSIPAGGFFLLNSVVFPTLPAAFLSNDGSVIRLLDAAGAPVDDVGYGNKGSAAFGFNTAGRSPDGDDTNDWARDWEYRDDSVDAACQTPGAPNRQTAPLLGSSLILNELDWSPAAGANDRLEIYNPLLTPVNLQGWFISDGDGYCRIANPILVAPGGVVALTETVLGEGMDCPGNDAIDFGANDVAYLYNPNLQRVDQIGITGSVIGAGETLQRCLDGNGPNDGFDYASTSGGVSYFNLPATVGLLNNSICRPIPDRTTSWGAIKSRF